MNIALNKINSLIKNNRNIFTFLVILMLIGIISGSIFGCIIKAEDKKQILDYINEYLNNISNINYLLQLKNNIIGSLLQIGIIWILGFSIIGLPVIIFLYFSYAFSLGLILISFIINYNFKGIFYTLIYLIFKSLFIFIILFLVLFAITVSFKILSILFKKKNIDFKLLLKRYIGLLFIFIVLCTISILLEVFVMPFTFNFITRF